MIRKTFGQKSVRYLISGGTAFSAEYGAFLVLFYTLAANSVVANTISFLVGLVISFSLNRMWVFYGEHKNKVGHQLILYASLAGVNLIITNLAIVYLVNVGVAAYLAKVLLIVCVAIWNFVIFQRIIFKHIQA